jgi:hypothetical protein
LDGETVTPADAIDTIFSCKTQTGVSRYIQNLHSKELERLSNSALNEFRKPKPLIDKLIPLSTNQRLKVLSSPFAPKGADITVIPHII